MSPPNTWVEMVEGADSESWLDLTYCGSRNPAAGSLDELAGHRIETADTEPTGDGDDDALPRFVFLSRGEAEAEIRRLAKESPMIDRSVEGQRIRLVSCSDPYTRLAPGSLGTATFLNESSFGTTLNVRWDDGSSLGLVQGEDRWEVVAP